MEAADDTKVDAAVTEPQAEKAPSAAEEVAKETTAAAGGDVDQKSEEKTAEKSDEKAEKEAGSKTEEKAAENTDDKTGQKTDVEAKQEKQDTQDSGRRNGRARGNKQNRKFDPSTQPISSDPNKIRAQVEFYFSDSNLPLDKFMWEQTGGVANKPVPISKICEFGRMRRFQPYSAVVAALRESNFLVVQGAEGKETVKRRKAYEQHSQARQRAEASSLYVKGFGEETPTTQFDLEAFFTQYSPVNSVRLRRTADNTFKGSVFVEFPDPEAAKKFAEMDPPPTWQGQPLKIMFKKAYIDEKAKLIAEGKLQPSVRHGFFEGKDYSAKDKKNKAKFDPDNWKERRERDQKSGSRGGRGGRGNFRGRGHGGSGGRDRRGADEKAKLDDGYAATDIGD